MTEMKMNINILDKIFLFFAFIVHLSSCHFYTAISYRADKSEEYFKQDGYILSCKKDGDQFIVGTYTPDSWGEQFYYDYLAGIKSYQKVKIINTKLKFIDTGDTLALKEIRKEREYIYYSTELDKIIDNNKQLQLKIYMKLNDDTTIIEKTFILLRHKQSYPTGTFPHS